MRPGPKPGYKQRAEHVAKRCKTRTVFDPLKTKVCSRCRVPKIATDFRKRMVKLRTGEKNALINSYCRGCEVKVSMESRSRTSTPAEIAEKYRKWSLRAKYGISLEDYEAMLKVQGNVCAMCKQPSKKTLAVDHDHETGKVRGLLCSDCNLLLGKFGDLETVLTAAIEYLRRFR